MKNNIHKIVLTVFLLVTAVSWGQKAAEKRAEREFDKYAFIESRDIFMRLAERGERSVEIFSKLGDSYYYNNDYPNAHKWYTELFNMDVKDIPRAYYFRYAQTLKSVGYYKEADKTLAKFYELANDKANYLPSVDPNYLSIIDFQKGRFQIENVSVNTSSQDFGAAFYGPTSVVFASAVDTGVFFKRRHVWNDEPFLDLYMADRDSYGRLSNQTKFDSRINSILHEATPTFSKDLKTVYFTRNNFTDGKIKEDDKDINKLKIYKSVKDGKRWSDPQPVSFSSDSYSTSHPALSPDGKFLYFSSNMPGSAMLDEETIKETDIWRVSISENGVFGTPENLSVNTVGRESYPFVSKNGNLYFASNGHAGLGGLDIFVSTISEDGTLSTPVNVGEPANSKNDDFAFIIDDESQSGYFSSNRSGGKGDDDIYSFVQLETLKVKCDQTLTGTVINAITDEEIGKVMLSIKDDKGTVLNNLQTSDNGNFASTVGCDTQLFVRAIKEGYETEEELVNIPSESGTTDVVIKMTPKIAYAGIGDDLGKSLRLKPIYFDLDKSNIRPDAAAELAKVLVVLENNPTMVIDIRSHTDSRASFSYNESLSGRRASSTRAWLISKGISPARLTAKGFGESQLINNCSDGVSCSEEQHQLNRRSEFIVIAL
jgi:outer membrane protein OmpA-like peptidoglycan-associated protein/tetratricopeptide (TPR) repeat protein